MLHAEITRKEMFYLMMHSTRVCVCVCVCVCVLGVKCGWYVGLRIVLLVRSFVCLFVFVVLSLLLLLFGRLMLKVFSNTAI